MKPALSVRAVISGPTNRRTPEQSPERCSASPEVKPLAVEIIHSNGGDLIDDDETSVPSSRRHVSRRRGNRGDLLASAFRGRAGAEAADVGGSFKLQKIVIKDGWIETCSQEPGRSLDVQDREWKRQFCVCQDGSLLIYEGIKSTAPDAGLLAGDATIEDCCETELSSPLIIRVGGDGIAGPVSLALKLPSVELKHSWLSSIRQALEDSTVDRYRPRSCDGMGSTSAEISEHGIESCAETVPRGETELEDESNEGASVGCEGDQVGSAGEAQEDLADGFSALPSVDDGKGIHLGSLSFSLEETAQKCPSVSF